MDNKAVLNEFLDERAMEYFNAHNEDYEKQLGEFSKMDRTISIDLASGNDFSVVDGKVIENK